RARDILRARLPRLQHRFLHQVVGEVGVAAQAAAEGAQMRQQRRQLALETGVVERTGGGDVGGAAHGRRRSGRKNRAEEKSCIPSLLSGWRRRCKAYRAGGKYLASGPLNGAFEV